MMRRETQLDGRHLFIMEFEGILDGWGKYHLTVSEPSLPFKLVSFQTYILPLSL
jgi:hypothetical protein